MSDKYDEALDESAKRHRQARENPRPAGEFITLDEAIDRRMAEQEKMRERARPILEKLNQQYAPGGLLPHQDDPVNHPTHYRGFSNNAEVIDITENLTFNAGNVVKYAARAGRIDGQNKGNPVEDLRKAIWYAQRELKRIGGDQ